LRLFSFGGYGLALAALALVVLGAYDSYPRFPFLKICATKNVAVYILIISSDPNRIFFLLNLSFVISFRVTASDVISRASAGHVTRNFGKRRYLSPADINIPFSMCLPHKMGRGGSPSSVARRVCFGASRQELGG